jgi:hypothetical protein
VWVIGRTQTNGPGDYAAVRAFQDGMRITELGQPAGPTADPITDLDAEPLRLVNAMTAVEFFTTAARCLKTIRPHSTDYSQLARIALLGIVPGHPFDANRFDSAQQAEIEAGAAYARESLIAAPARQGVDANGWVVLTQPMGVYGNDYFRRAMIALVGLGANPAEDAIYPLLVADSDGRPTVGDIDYNVHFKADQLPPVDAFWSITMYDTEGFQVANSLNRFAIGDRDPLLYNDDGSLDIHLSRTDPGGRRTTNWLPAPSGPVGITMRLYAPRPSALDRTWTPPPITRA